MTVTLRANNIETLQITFNRLLEVLQDEKQNKFFNFEIFPGFTKGKSQTCTPDKLCLVLAYHKVLIEETGFLCKRIKECSKVIAVVAIDVLEPTTNIVKIKNDVSEQYLGYLLKLFQAISEATGLNFDLDPNYVDLGYYDELPQSIEPNRFKELYLLFDGH